MINYNLILLADPLPAEQRAAGGGDTNVALKDTLNDLKVSNLPGINLKTIGGSAASAVVAEGVVPSVAHKHPQQHWAYLINIYFLTYKYL